MKIPKKELLDADLPYDGDVIEDNMVDHSRWAVGHEVIFRWKDGKTYRAYYRHGATESQDERAWEYEDEVECTEVHQVEKTIKVWEAV